MFKSFFKRRHDGKVVVSDHNAEESDIIKNNEENGTISANPMGGHAYLEKLAQLEAKVSELSKRQADLDFLFVVAPQKLADMYPLLSMARSQNRQDLFVLAELGLKRDGFFVDVGAASGVEISNTYLLETHFGWKGILAEPDRRWLPFLQRDRRSYIDRRCVWKQSGERVSFQEASAGEMSTIADYMRQDHESWFAEGKSYDVETVSLEDLLKEHGAPSVIDFLSIDTEGSEFDILSAFDFSSYKFRSIVCEHNYQPARDDIYQLLTSNGYIRKFENVSGWDDWYVSADLT